MGNAWRFRKSEIDRWIAEQEQETRMGAKMTGEEQRNELHRQIWATRHARLRLKLAEIDHR
ncbi:hypothetical protein [Sulfitobacter sp. TBRI5]|uniref:hypothetical protein n=1 Tax=Sulfitobacter sp. TBRI5 TaxID=2989732 RepID=UPI003D9BE3C6